MVKLTKEYFNELAAVTAKTWKEELNHFEDSLLEDISRLAGFIPDAGQPTVEERRSLSLANWLRHKKREDIPSGESAARADSPASFSWGNVDGRNYLTTVKNQRFCNSCVAFGTLAVVEIMARIEKGTSTVLSDLSEAQLFFKSSDDHNCFTGWNIGGALAYLQQTGVIPERDFPYDFDCSFQALPEGWEDKTTVIGKDVTLDSHYGMKKWIREKGPLISVIELHPDFLFYKEGVYHPVKKHSLGGHCVAVVGYDDESGSWLCKNSWGRHWGDRGYFRVAYGECGIDARMIGIEGFEKIYEG
ncbi:MAG: hypothetical protein JXR86_05080 [Spirochaetales bacterium]|nr:hypothetical protein [Spirochaetales bacterium]